MRLISAYAFSFFAFSAAANPGFCDKLFGLIVAPKDDVDNVRILSDTVVEQTVQEMEQYGHISGPEEAALMRASLKYSPLFESQAMQYALARELRQINASPSFSLENALEDLHAMSKTDAKRIAAGIRRTFQQRLVAHVENLGAAKTRAADMKMKESEYRDLMRTWGSLIESHPQELEAAVRVLLRQDKLPPAWKQGVLQRAKAMKGLSQLSEAKVTRVERDGSNIRVTLSGGENLYVAEKVHALDLSDLLKGDDPLAAVPTQLSFDELLYLGLQVKPTYQKYWPGRGYRPHSVEYGPGYAPSQKASNQLAQTNGYVGATIYQASGGYNVRGNISGRAQIVLTYLDRLDHALSPFEMATLKAWMKSPREISELEKSAETLAKKHAPVN